MSFGRTDLILDGPGEPADSDRILRALMNLWPHAVIARADVPVTTPIGLRAANWYEVLEFQEYFVARDEPALRAWLADGATKENADTMVHVLLTPVSLTAVVDDPASEPGFVLRRTFERIRWNRATRAGPPTEERAA